MTSGSPVRHLIRFALPILLGNLFQQLYSVADAMVLGRGVSVGALAAVGATDSTVFFVQGFIIGLTNGCAILTAQRFGAGDPTGIRRTTANAVYLALLAGLAITAAGLLGSRALLDILDTPADIFDGALLYLRIIFAGMLAAVLYNMFSGVLQALGDSVTPLVILAVSAAANVGLDALFVIGFHWGVAGAAAATVIAKIFSAGMCLFVLSRIELMRFQRGDRAFDRALFAKLFRLGVPVGIMNSVTAAGMMLLQNVVNAMGSTVVAAYTTGAKILNLALTPGDILGIALGTYVGQNLGAGRLDRVRLGVRKAVGMSVALNLTIGLLVAVFARELTAVFVTGAERAVIDATQPYLVTIGAGVWIVGLLFLYRFALQSLGDTVVPMISGGVELAARVGTVLLLTRRFHLGFFAVGFAEVAAWIGAGALLMAGYYIRLRNISRRPPQAADTTDNG